MNLYKIRSFSTAETFFLTLLTHFLCYYMCITCINLLSTAAISFLDFIHGFTVGQSSFMLHLIYIYMGPSEKST